MSRADQREGEPAGDTGRAGADMEEGRRFLREQPCLGDEGEAGGRERAGDEHAEALPALLAAGARFIADLQHLGRRHAFRIGQVGVDDQSAPQGIENITPRMPPTIVAAAVVQ